MYLDSPILEQSNRVLCAYTESNESFLRVNFLHESGYRYQFGEEIDGPAFTACRVKTLLYDGLIIAGHKFEYLAYSLSALKDHSVWFVRPSNNPSRKTLINVEGNFGNLQFDRNLMYYPARYGARISQAFTTTDAVQIGIGDPMVLEHKDICTPDGRYQFTEGVGAISRELSQRIWSQLRKSKRQRPQTTALSAYQIRFRGSKGMVCVDHTLRGSVIRLRPSMIKFHAPETTQDIEIARAYDRPGLYLLNRPLIMLLEGLGVPYWVFKYHQDMAVEATKKATKSLKSAALMENHGLGSVYKIPFILKSLEKLDIDRSGNVFYVGMRALVVNHVLRDLKFRACIPIPGAWTLVGVADTHQYLKPNQIFACIRPVHCRRRYLSGRVLISHSPVIHPGDVQIVEAIGPLPPNSCFEEEELPNMVVFSAQGNRPLPSFLAGGDLDGDLYNLIPLDPELPYLRGFEPRNIHEPASYQL